MATPRTHCPECNGSRIIELIDVLSHPDADFFWCSTCRAMWHLPKGANWPPSKTLLGDKRPDTGV